MVGRRLRGRKAPVIRAGRTSIIIDEKISELKAAQKTHSGKGKPAGGTAIVLPMWSPKRFAAEWTDTNHHDAVWSSTDLQWPGEDWWIRQSSEEQEQAENQTSHQQGSRNESLRQTAKNHHRRNSDFAFEEIPISALHQYANAANTHDASSSSSSRQKSLTSRNTRDNPKSKTKEQQQMGGEDDIDHIMTNTTRNSQNVKSQMDIDDNIRQVAKSGGLPMHVIERILQHSASHAPTRDMSPSPPPPPPPLQQTSLSSSAAAAAAANSNAKVRARGSQKKPLAPPPPSNQTTTTKNHHLEQQKSPHEEPAINHHHQQHKKETRFRDDDELLDPIVSSRTPKSGSSKNKTNYFNNETMNNERSRLHRSQHSPLLLVKSSSSSSHGASAWFGALLSGEVEEDSNSNVSDESRGGADHHHHQRTIPRDAPHTTNNKDESLADTMMVNKRATAAAHNNLTFRRAAAPTARTRAGEPLLFMEQAAIKSPKRRTPDQTSATTTTPPVSKTRDADRLLDREIIEVDRLLSALRPMLDRTSNSQARNITCPRPEPPLSPLGVRIDPKRTLPSRLEQREPEGNLGIRQHQQQQPPPVDNKPSNVKKEAAVHKKGRASKQAENVAGVKGKNPETRPSSSSSADKETMESRDAPNKRTTSPNDSLLDADSGNSDKQSSEDPPKAGAAKSHVHAKPLSSSGLNAVQRDTVTEEAITLNNERKSKSGPYCESECASGFQTTQARTEEEASSFYTNARSDLAIYSNLAPPSGDKNNLYKDSVGVEVQLKQLNGSHNEDECSLFSSLQSVVIPEEAAVDLMVAKEGPSLERKPSNEEYKSWNPYTMYGGACRDAQAAANGNESDSVVPSRRTHPSPHHDYWKSFSTIKTLGSFDSLSVIDEIDGVISSDSRILLNGNRHQTSRDAIERPREEDRRVEDSRKLLCINDVSRYYPEMTPGSQQRQQQPQLAPHPETPASSIWVNDCASQRTFTQTAFSVDSPSPLRKNLRAAPGNAGFVWKRGVWQPQTPDHIRSSTTTPRQIPTSDEEIPRPLADSVLYLMRPLLSGDTEDVTALTEDDGRTTLKGDDDDATDAAQDNDCSFMCGGCTWNLNGIFC